MEMTQEELIHCWGYEIFDHCYKHAKMIRRQLWEICGPKRPITPEEEEPPIDLILAVRIGMINSVEKEGENR